MVRGKVTGAEARSFLFAYFGPAKAVPLLQGERALAWCEVKSQGLKPSHFGWRFRHG
jgi:hypothetical protein